MTLPLLLFLAAVPVPAGYGTPWAEFSRAPALRLIKTRVEVGTLGYDRNRKQLDFWLRRTIVRGGAQHEEVSWTDTRTCPAASSTLASMRNIPVPKFAPIGSSEGPPIVLDGIGYSLRTYSDQGELTAKTNVGTPLASWIELALKTLEPCWRRSAPARSP
jgi:hypothetical protein